MNTKTIFKWSLILTGHYIWLSIVLWVPIYIALKSGYQFSNSYSSDIFVLMIAIFITINKYQKTTSGNFKNIDLIKITTLFALYLSIGAFVFISIEKELFSLRYFSMIFAFGFPVQLIFSIFVALVFSYFLGKKYNSNSKVEEKTTSLIDQAKNAYIHRDYKKAYTLFCKAELEFKLDDMSFKFKELAKKRLENS